MSFLFGEFAFSQDWAGLDRYREENIKVGLPAAGENRVVFMGNSIIEPADKIIELNKMIKDYADKNGIIYVDYFSPMVNDRRGLKAEYSEDGIHPNTAGYKVMEPLVEDAISKAIRQK